MVAAVMATRPGMVLDERYRLVERLAGGGMADVWLGIDELLGRSVAVKTLSPRLAADEVDRERFREEARTAARLSHPGIAAVHDFGEAYPGQESGVQPTAYLVMELVAGQSLAGLLKSGPLGVGRTLHLIVQTARALDYAHRSGVVHRDIKPANLMVTPQHQVKVTDFGIARRLDHDPLTATGVLIGTPDYLAPEVSMGASATVRSDIYALGIVAYECLTGRRPFRGNSNVAILTAHVEQQPDPLPSSVPGGVAAAVMTAMQKDPDRRFATAGAFAEALEQLLGRRVLGDPSVPPAARSPRARPDQRWAGHSPVASGLSADTPVTQGIRYDGAGFHQAAVFDHDDVAGYDHDDVAGYHDDSVRGQEVSGAESSVRGGRQLVLLICLAAVMAAGLAVVGTARGRTLLDRLIPVGSQQAAAATPTTATSTGATPTAVAPAAGTPTGGSSGTADGTAVPRSTVMSQTGNGGAQESWAAARGVPDVVGRSVARARNLLAEAGFRVGDTIAVDGTDVPPGRVARTHPQVGSSVPPGSRIDLYVAPGVTVPDLVGRQVTEAVDTLQNRLHLQVALQYRVLGQAPGTVVAQDVRNTTVAPGARVTLTVSVQQNGGWGGQAGQAGQAAGQSGQNAGPAQP